VRQWSNFSFQRLQERFARVATATGQQVVIAHPIAENEDLVAL
jgi:hypothetical protein